MPDKMEKEEKIRQNETANQRPFGMRDKLGYLFGDFGNDFSFIFASSYLMVFYTKVLGLAGSVVGALFLGARIVDAFTDVTMGRIVDKMPSARDGRFRPWIRRMCIPVAVASTLMYMYFVRDWAYGIKMTYVVVTYLLWSSFCYTAINIPYGSMASVISADAGERASLSTFRSIGASLAGLVIGTLVPLIVYDTDALGNQIVNPVRFTLTAVIFGIFAIICYVLCYVLCTERITFDRKTSVQKAGEQREKVQADHTISDDSTDVTEKRDAGQGIGAILSGLGRSRPLLAMVCSALVLLLASMLSQTMNNYLFLDYFRNAKAMAVLNIISIGGMLLVAPFVTRLARTVGKKEAGAVGMLLAGGMYVLIYFLRIRSIPLFMVLLFVGSIGVGLFNMITWAFITDIIDYQEVTTGSREDGTVYAVYSFARKLGQALAGGLGGFALTAIGYVSDAAAQTTEVSNRIYTVATLVPGVCYLVVFLIMQFWYPLTRKEVERNAEILAKRRN